jgi:hypothetical protein
VFDTFESEVGHTGDEQNLAADVLNVLEEVVVVEVSHVIVVPRNA